MSSRRPVKSELLASSAVRVLHVISGDLWAGAEVATFHLLRALKALPDVRVAAVVLNAGELETRLRDAGIETRLLPEAELSVPRLARAVRAAAEDADLVHAHRYKESLLAAASGRPWVATQHGRPEPQTGTAAWRMRAYVALDLVLKRAAARRVIAVSDEVREWLATRIGASRLARVWNGIADPQRAVTPAPWEARPMRVGVLGRLAPVKRFETAVECVAGVPGVELEIVGDGPERGRLGALRDALGVADRVHLVGHLPDPLPRVARWRALLVPSLHEGNPIAVIEALALGTPVVAAGVRGVDEILAGRGGCSLAPGLDAAGWAASLRAFLADPESGRAASEAARQRYLEDFTDALAAERTRAVYAEALGTATAAGRG